MKNSILFIQFLFVSCFVKNEPDVNIVARVGGEKLTKKDLLHLIGGPLVNSDAISREIKRWVENKLLYRAAVSIGLDKDVSLFNKRDLFYENLLVSSFIDIQLRNKIKTTKKEVSNYYIKNKNSFKRTDDEVVVKHFVFSTNDSAKSFIKEIKKTKPTVDMESFLKNQQIETKTIRKKEAGSNLVGFVFSGTAGEFVGPKKHNNKHHVFQILQKYKKGSFLGLERVYGDIYQRLYKEKEALVLRGVVDSLYLNSDVFISQEPISQ